MRVSVITFITLFMWMQGNVDSVRIVELRVSAHMAEGGDALLGCRIDMEQDSLYALKWFKDGKEFYRYVPKAVPPVKSFFVNGVNVDLNRSSLSVVALKHLTRNSTGVYRCEVYGEAPAFAVVSQEKHVMIDLLPKSGPQVYGLQNDYPIGSNLDVNCTTSPSRPEAQLKWFINGEPAPSSYLQGPYLVIPTNRPYTYQAKLRLNFTVQPNHFDKRGTMTIKCQATIAPLYLQETHFTFSTLTTTEPNDNPVSDDATSTEFLIMLLILPVLLLLMNNSILINF